MFNVSLFAQSKVGRIDIQKVLLTVKEGKNVRNQLKKEFDKKQAEIKKEENKIKKAQQAYEKKSKVMNDKARLKKERSIQEMIIGLQQKTQKYQQEIQGKEQVLKKPILERVRKIIDSVAKKGGFDLVFEVTASPVFAKNVKDITSDVVKAYDKEYK
tara:strand:+ start:5317 stop:5787 length:471 start_codon:yes stop_codon:yes gene_type:complete